LRVALESAGFTDVSVAPTSVDGRGPRHLTFRAAARAWQTALRAIYVLERGADAENPRILSKTIVAQARRPFEAPPT
jgi:hypothetical protein